MSDLSNLSRREREVMEVLFRRGSATGREVWEVLGAERTYSTIRKILSILEEKGYVRHRSDGQTFVYRPKLRRETAAVKALDGVMETFFAGSAEAVMSSLLGREGNRMTGEQLERLSRMIEEAKAAAKEGAKR